MRTDAHDPASAAQAGANLAVLVEEVDSPPRPVHPAVAIGEKAGTADAGFEVVE